MVDRLEQQIEPVTLLPCPFCGKLPLPPCDTSYGYWSVVCGDENECAVKPDAQGGSELETIAAWNARTTPAPSQHSELVGRLEAALRISLWNEARSRGASQDTAIKEVADKIASLTQGTSDA